MKTKCFSACVPEHDIVTALACTHPMGNAKIPADEAKSAAAPSTSSATAEAEGGLKKETSTTQAPPPPAGPLSGAAMYNPVMQQAHPGHTPGLAPQGASAAPVYYTAMPLAQGGAVPRHARPSNGTRRSRFAPFADRVAAANRGFCFAPPCLPRKRLARHA